MQYMCIKYMWNSIKYVWKDNMYITECVCIFSFLINLLTASLTPRESGVTLFFIIGLDMLLSNQRMRFIKPLPHFLSHIIFRPRPSIAPASIFRRDEVSDAPLISVLTFTYSSSITMHEVSLHVPTYHNSPHHWLPGKSKRVEITG